MAARPPGGRGLPMSIAKQKFVKNPMPLRLRLHALWCAALAEGLVITRLARGGALAYLVARAREVELQIENVDAWTHAMRARLDDIDPKHRPRLGYTEINDILAAADREHLTAAE